MSTLLIVDDDAETVRFMEELLAEPGRQILSAGTPDRALALVRERWSEGYGRFHSSLIGNKWQWCCPDMTLPISGEVHRLAALHCKRGNAAHQKCHNRT